MKSKIFIAIFMSGLMSLDLLSDEFDAQPVSIKERAALLEQKLSHGNYDRSEERDKDRDDRLEQRKKYGPLHKAIKSLGNRSRWQDNEDNYLDDDYYASNRSEDSGRRFKMPVADKKMAPRKRVREEDNDDEAEDSEEDDGDYSDILLNRGSSDQPSTVDNIGYITQKSIQGYTSFLKKMWPGNWFKKKKKR